LNSVTDPFSAVAFRWCSIAAAFVPATAVRPPRASSNSAMVGAVRYFPPVVSSLFRIVSGESVRTGFTLPRSGRSAQFAINPLRLGFAPVASAAEFTFVRLG
jgi:hypothetical protein